MSQIIFFQINLFLRHTQTRPGTSRRRRTGRDGMHPTGTEPDLTALPTEPLQAILAMVPFHGGLMRVPALPGRAPRDGSAGRHDRAEPGRRRRPLRRARRGRGRRAAEVWSPGCPGQKPARRGPNPDEAAAAPTPAWTNAPRPKPAAGTSLLHERPQDTVAGDRGEYEVATNTMVGSGRDTDSAASTSAPWSQTLRVNPVHGATRDALAAGAARPNRGARTSAELADRARDGPGFSVAARAEAVALYERTREFIEAVSQLPGRQRDKKFVVFRLGITGMPRRPQFQFNLVVPVYDYLQQFWKVVFGRAGYRAGGPRGSRTNGDSGNAEPDAGG